MKRPGSDERRWQRALLFLSNKKDKRADGYRRVFGIAMVLERVANVRVSP
jgi:hypothetical protein